MSSKALQRYEVLDNGRLVIDISSYRVEDLYNNFDKSAPYTRRDLDQDLVDYLIDCASELGNMPFALRFTIEKQPDDRRQSRVRQSINSYFHYLADHEHENINRLFRKSGILFLIGLIILSISVLFNKIVGLERSVIANIFAEGLTIAAWVSLWEALAVFVVEWFPLRKNIRVYKLIANADITFRTVN